ncbi:MAG: transporter substrate-binding domain-containing protein [Pseudomonadota bacterium]
MWKTLIAAAALGAVSTAALADGHTVRMGTEGAYPPYNFINDAGELDGFEIEFGNMLCEHAKLDCTWVKNDWDSIIPNLVSGNYDVIMAGMSITEERDQVIDFTQGYIPATFSFYVAPAGAKLDLTSPDTVIAAQVNTIQAGHVAASGATALEFATPDETVAAVKNGEADAVLADDDYLKPIVADSGGELEVVDQVRLGGGVGLGIRESDAELRAKLDAAIAHFKASGELNALLAKWFKDDAPQW